MALLNVVRNERGTELAAFLSSIDARAYAENEASSCSVTLTVTDYAGFVTEHRYGQPVVILTEGDAAFGDARKNITDNFHVAEQAPA